MLGEGGIDVIFVALLFVNLTLRALVNFSKKRDIPRVAPEVRCLVLAAEFRSSW